MLTPFRRGDKEINRSYEKKVIGEFFPVDLTNSNNDLQHKLLSNKKIQKNEPTVRKLKRPKNESIFTIQCHYCSSFINLLDFKMHSNQLLDDILKLNLKNSGSELNESFLTNCGNVFEFDGNLESINQKYEKYLKKSHVFESPASRNILNSPFEKRMSMTGGFMNNQLKLNSSNNSRNDVFQSPIHPFKAIKEKLTPDTTINSSTAIKKDLDINIEEGREALREKIDFLEKSNKRLMENITKLMAIKLCR